VTARGADLVVGALADGGVRHLFSLSGNQILSVYDATIGCDLRIIHTRHEAAAVHMADAWGRLGEEPGVALVTAGPGHLNALSALYGALMAESPVVLLSGHAPIGQLGRGCDCKHLRRHERKRQTNHRPARAPQLLRFRHTRLPPPYAYYTFPNTTTIQVFLGCEASLVAAVSDSAAWGQASMQGKV